jgi:predicted DNA binding CopG/RHH family protein
VLVAFTMREKGGKRRCATMKKKLPTVRSDGEAEAFVEKADLTDYDLSGLRPVKLEFEKKEVGPRMRAVKKRATPVARPATKTRS